MFLKVKKTIITEDCEPLIEIDQYVPIRTTLVRGEYAIKRNVRFSDSNTSLFEVSSRVDDGKFCHLALVFFKQRSARSIEVTDASIQGIPVLDIESEMDFKGNLYRGYADFGETISAYICDSFVEVCIGGATFCDRIIALGRLQFLLRGEDLVGIRVQSISQSELKYLDKYI